jgi:hypothetical protein
LDLVDLLACSLRNLFLSRAQTLAIGLRQVQSGRFNGAIDVSTFQGELEFQFRNSRSLTIVEDLFQFCPRFLLLLFPFLADSGKGRLPFLVAKIPQVSQGIAIDSAAILFRQFGNLLNLLFGKF